MWPELRATQAEIDFPSHSFLPESYCTQRDTHTLLYFLIFIQVFYSENKLIQIDFLSFSLGGRYVKVWDLLKGGQPLVSLKNHHKTVTCLRLSSNGQRLLSASLDRYGDRCINSMHVWQSSQRNVLNQPQQLHTCLIRSGTWVWSNADPLFVFQACKGVQHN